MTDDEDHLRRKAVSGSKSRPNDWDGGDHIRHRANVALVVFMRTSATFVTRRRAAPRGRGPAGGVASAGGGLPRRRVLLGAVTRGRVLAQLVRREPQRRDTLERRLRYLGAELRSAAA